MACANCGCVAVNASDLATALVALQGPRALDVESDIIGINNRDLRTFEVRLETALELLPEVPPMVTAVAESGLSRPADLARLRATRCDAVLIGEAFMSSPDPAATLAELMAAARG